jgi:hypothetical protein
MARTDASPELKEQLDDYRKKFELYQESISSNSNTFLELKNEMQSKGAMLKQADKDNHNLKKKSI